MYRGIILSVLMLTLDISLVQSVCTENALKPLRAHETDCAKFYQCSNGNDFVFTCGPGTVFDEKLQVCNWPSAVDCKTKTSPNKEPSKPPKDSKKPPAKKPKGDAKPPAKGDAKPPAKGDVKPPAKGGKKPPPAKATAKPAKG